ncbi:hypothetical protein [Bacillus sp. FJAT-50079]|uniref:hypothetical protein n=1 Tax=Bacillus sp. FJAT-50079 TaxID=2833577 RepID=UPI001BCA3CED|nr:hypothetical protein [Bacillus sp. FJAT-50079]MBS4209565.1 hypothetical protein [Bacillus sp. FJAT-50079]
MNKTILSVGIVVVITSLLGNYLFFAKNQLDEPIFLQHYYERPFMEEMTIDLHYIKNRYSDREMDIAWVTIPGLDVMLIPEYEYTIQAYTHYEYKVVRLSFPDEIETKIDDRLEFDELTVFFTDGETKTLRDNKLILYKQEDEAPFEWMGGGGSSDNDGFQRIKAEENITLIGLQTPYKEELPSTISLTLNDEQLNLKDPEQDFFPISFAKGDDLSLTYRFSFDDNDMNRLNVYNLDINFLGKNENGEHFVKTAVPIFYQPYISEKEMRDLVREAKK